ncbi:MAG TPA: hypothetical protein VNB94_00440 [Mycobacteriales bacterium]|nr:hypothetical protein [Mycobacteriales bacterium]
MRGSTVSSIRRAGALVLAVFAVVAGVNTAFVAAYAVDRGRLAGPVGLAAGAGVVITGALVWSAVHLWSRHDVIEG